MRVAAVCRRRRFQPPDAASFKRASPPGITPGDGYSAKAMEQYKEQMRAAAANADRFSPLDSTLVIVLLRNVYDWNVGGCHNNERPALTALTPPRTRLIVRNVYDWTEAMRRLPYHSPSHVNLTLDELLQADADLASEQRTFRPQFLAQTRRLSPPRLCRSLRGPSAAATPTTLSH